MCKNNDSVFLLVKYYPRLLGQNYPQLNSQEYIPLRNTYFANYQVNSTVKLLKHSFRYDVDIAEKEGQWKTDGSQPNDMNDRSSCEGKLLQYQLVQFETKLS